jgi:uncharacterized protein
MASANEQLCDAAERGYVAEIERQIGAGADPNKLVRAVFYDCTPLQCAARKGHLAAIVALLKAGARVDGADSSGLTPLMYAAVGGHTAATDVLLGAGADVHRASNHGNTALHWASRNGHSDAARVLLEAGARADVRDRDSKRPIDLVRAPLVCSLRPRDSITSLGRRVAPAQVCDGGNKHNKAALRALLAAAAPWSRRRPLAIACYADAWEWEA